MAKIKLAEKEKQDLPAENSFKGMSTDLLFFIAINVLAVGVSTWQTFIGYEADVAGNFIIALSIALMSGVLFLAMNFEIRKRRLKGQEHILLVVMYLIPLGISFPGNFNAFYTNQTGKDFLKNEIISYKAQMNNTKNEAVQALQSSVDINSFERNYNSYLGKLETEYNKPPSGWGSVAQQRWIELVQFLNDEGGNIKPTVIEGTRGSIRYNRALSFASNEKDNIVHAKNNTIKQSLTAIEDKYNPVNARIDSLINLSTPVYTSAMLDDLVEAENYIRSQASSLLGNDSYFSNIALTPSEESGIGTIKHTFTKAFIERKEPSATAFSLFFSLIIDLAALLYILVFIPYNRTKTAKAQGRISGPQRI